MPKINPRTCAVCVSLLITAATASGEQAGKSHSVTANRLSPEELEAGWILLFDGETLFGWKKASKTEWNAVDGEIRADSGEVGLLHTTTQFADFELMCEFKAGPDTNSGIFLRTSPRPESPTRGCYELNIAGPKRSPFLFRSKRVLRW